MTSHDKDWEDFRRDCDFFPAYTDYILGVDTRPQVALEPGLHPQIYPPLVPAGYEIPAAMPSRAQCYAASTPDMNWSMSDQPIPDPRGRNMLSGTQRIELGLVTPPSPVFLSNGALEQQQGMGASAVPEIFVPSSWNAASNGSPYSTQQQSSLIAQFGSLPMNTLPNIQQPQVIPQSVPSLLPQPESQSSSIGPRLLQPDELLGSQFDFILPDVRPNFNNAINQKWNIVNESLSRDEQITAINFLLKASHMVFTRQRECFVEQQHRATQSRNPHGAPYQNQPVVNHRNLHGAQHQQPFNAVIFQAYVHKYIPQLRRALILRASRASLTAPEQLLELQRAEVWLAQFKATIPPEGQPYIQHILHQLNVDENQSRDYTSATATTATMAPLDEKEAYTDDVEHDIKDGLDYDGISQGVEN